MPSEVWEGIPLVSHPDLFILKKTRGQLNFAFLRFVQKMAQMFQCKLGRQSHRLLFFKAINSNSLSWFLGDWSQAYIFSMTPIFSLSWTGCCSFSNTCCLPGSSIWTVNTLALSLGPSNYKAKFEDFNLFWHTGWWFKI